MSFAVVRLLGNGISLPKKKSRWINKSRRVTRMLRIESLESRTVGHHAAVAAP